MKSFQTHPWMHLHPGHTRQVSSFGKDPERGGEWCGFRPAPALIKRILLEPGETHTLAALDGAGVIYRMLMTTLLPFNLPALRGLVLRIYWDGEANPSVEAPFGDFYGAPFGQYRQYVSAPLSLTSGGYLSLWPMPYGAGARIELTNECPQTIDPLFYNLNYQELERDPADGLRFHAHWRRENPTQAETPYTILDARGKGHYVGSHLSIQNLEWWLRPPLKDILFPRGFGLGMMEGWESIYVDGEKTASMVGTGTEDFYNGAWYYLPDGTFFTPDHGCTLRDLLRARVAIYRFDLDFPLVFNQSLLVQLDHGFRNAMKCDYSSTAYWYQLEPHTPFPPLPPLDRRRPTPALGNIAQAALLLGPPIAVGLALLRQRARRQGVERSSCHG